MNMMFFTAFRISFIPYHLATFFLQIFEIRWYFSDLKDVPRIRWMAHLMVVLSCIPVIYISFSTVKEKCSYTEAFKINRLENLSKPSRIRSSVWSLKADESFFLIFLNSFFWRRYLAVYCFAKSVSRFETSVCVWNVIHNYVHSFCA